jgi:hypothetical protein
VEGAAAAADVMMMKTEAYNKAFVNSFVRDLRR